MQTGRRFNVNMIIEIITFKFNKEYNLFIIFFDRVFFTDAFVWNLENLFIASLTNST